MTDEVVAEAYGARASEYAALLGSVEDSDERDRALIASWAASLEGPVLDAGCGPGHWTAFVHGLGLDVVGLDLVPEFLALARSRFPEVPFRCGSLRDPGVAHGSLGGILAWYSLIHLPPQDLPGAVAEFGRCLAPGGRLLIGFFEGPRVEAFDHAVTTAWFHPLDDLQAAVERAGLDVVHRSRRTAPGARDHGELLAVRR
ncbi:MULTISPECIES: class I SAM-dependent methyltransferase [unclassified Rathayibacter]|uniref:class I SAM-dependent methyltransferase n=1 Tax=unclassified Rathayibacter TaxID=2609250 RepID=UPI0007001B3C|nr:MULTISPECIES: class I SAM-dependent methyltransferase [unclassified Rathayibacter]KQQ05974.1 SAM-dependent methyltransferase [Rathayibacter sp. Leaf294]KQS13831.1 SAM-dependent methyltransferase [Rathayibacter sp. Leaf185]